jgi:hypothetical protein
MVASLITYPHEVSFTPDHCSAILTDTDPVKMYAPINQVLRTRLRQPALIPGGPLKYTGLWQTLRLVIAEEGYVEGPRLPGPLAIAC